jgi:hypothetical protein
MSGSTLVLDVRIDRSVVRLSAALACRVARLDRVTWRGQDAAGHALCLATGDDGPLVALAAPALLVTDAVSPAPAWAVVLANDAVAPQLAVMVCEVLGLVSARATPNDAGRLVESEAASWA